MHKLSHNTPAQASAQRTQRWHAFASSVSHLADTERLLWCLCALSGAQCPSSLDLTPGQTAFLQRSSLMCTNSDGQQVRGAETLFGGCAWHVVVDQDHKFGRSSRTLCVSSSY